MIAPVMRLATALRAWMIGGPFASLGLDEMPTYRYSGPARRILKLRLPWRKASSLHDRNFPHEFFVQWWAPLAFEEISEVVESYGEKRTWRGQTYVFLEVGPYIYWIDESSCKRTYREALDNSGYPGARALRKIRRRFGVNEK